MNRRRMLRFGAIALVVALSDVAQAQTAPDVRCRNVRMEHEGAAVSTGCPSPVGVCFEGTFRGNFVGKGTFFFSATSASTVPGDPFGRQILPGLLDYTTRNGTFTVDGVAVLDAEQGTFGTTGRITGGTGRFAGASGKNASSGVTSLDGSLTSTLRGTFCLPD